MFENSAIYFKSAKELTQLITDLNEADARFVGDAMLEVANRRYRWNIIAKEYFALLEA